MDWITGREPEGCREFEFPSREGCIYTSCYCEENIWKLCEKLKGNVEILNCCFAVFVSNDRRMVPLWYQKSSDGEDGLVAWDYHVFLVHKSGSKVDVYDFDTTLDFPTEFSVYLNKAIGDDSLLKTEFWRMFRVIPAEVYLKSFASDRRHMRRKDGSWLKDPPPYDPITCEGCVHNIDTFISMKKDEGVGEVLTLMGFKQLFESV